MNYEKKSERNFSEFNHVTYTSKCYNILKKSLFMLIYNFKILVSSD